MFYTVTIPIAGHFIVEIEADNEEEAIEKAWNSNTDDGEVEWEQLESFSEGNICCYPMPWKIEVEEE